MRGSEFAELKAFACVAAHANFARAAVDLGMSPSTLSQMIRALETRLGVRLLNRTTRSVALTHAGSRLLARFKPAMDEMDAAIHDVADLRDSPSGVLRVHASQRPASLFLEPVLGAFHRAYPNILLDLTVDEAVTDIVEAGYDVGIRLGEFIAADMVAVRLSDEQRQIAVASPAYLKQYGRPDTPADLLHHRCINWRQPGASGCYSWEFLTNGRWSSVAVKGPLIVSHRELAVSAAVQGVGIAFWAEERLHPLIAEGKLVPLLEDWCGSFPGWFAYYPRQRSMPLSVRAFVDSLRRDDSKV
jgi:DNA-binding transcriptional LysR family regulator